MEIFFKNLVHITHALTLLFFIVTCIYLYRKKSDSRLMKFLFWETVFWLFIQLKDIDRLIERPLDITYLSGVKLCIDTWCVPITLFLLMEITQPRRLNAKMITLLMIPTVLLTAGYVVSSSMTWCYILLAYSVVYGLFMSVAVIMAARKHDNYIKRYFSYTENICVEWVKKVVLLLFTMLVVWVVIIWTTPVTGDAIFYIFQIVVWSYIYHYSMKHQAVDVPVPASINPFYSEIEDQDEFDFEDETGSLAINHPFEAKLQQCMSERHMYLNPNLTISEVAFAIGTNRTYLSDYLNKKIGVNFYDYANKYRVMAACNILCDGSYKKLEEVAEMAGFNSLSTFHRSFKKIMAMTPLQYRKTIIE